MARRVIAAVLRLLVRVFFRRVEVVGEVPPGPVIFAINHPNALIDPVFLLCFAPRRISFLAKAPLLRMPVIGWFVRALDSIPVYRKQDNVAGSNRETFARAREVLQRGGAIAIFPEGTTHSDPKLRELKTGAARIALGATIGVSIVPTGLYYTAKQTFRSSALACFGPAIRVDPEPVDESGEPRRESVDSLTNTIERALAAVTLQADSHAALELIARAERIFSAGDDVALAREFELRRQFVEGYGFLRERDPGRLTRLESMIRQIDVDADADGVPVRLTRLLLAPVGIAGAALHWPVYRLIGFIATHFAGSDEMVATVKAIAGIVLYPVMWTALAIVAGMRFGIAWGIATVIVLPLLGYVALLTSETLGAIVARVRRPDSRAQQQAIRAEILSVSKSMSSSAGAAPSEA